MRRGPQGRGYSAGLTGLYSLRTFSTLAEAKRAWKEGLMDAYAVVETGGKQYLVKKGAVLDVELLGAKPGSKAKLSRVLAVSDGAALKVGTPEIEGAAVSVQVLDEVRAEKLVSFKKKRRKGYRKKIGHRQDLSRIQVESIG
jgi:large subunit ribosomal protein L21